MADIRDDGSEVFHFDIPDFPLSIKRNYIPANVKIRDLSIHWHEEIEITYVVSGSVNHQLNGKKVNLVAGEAIYINSKQLHLIQSDVQDCELYCLIFNPTLLCASNFIAQKYVSPIVENEKLDYFFLKENEESHKQILDSIIKIYELQSDPAYEMKTMKILYELWLALYDILPKVGTNAELINEDLHMVQKMLTKIHKSYSDNLNLSDICMAAGVGKTKGTKMFCQYLNMTPVDYLINYRLEIASRMLSETKQSVLDIALATGFSDSSYFARIFRNRVGMSPLKYREKMKDKMNE